MKKLTLIIFVIMISMSLCACDPWSGKRASDYEGSVWVAQEIDLWFWISDDNYKICHDRNFGYFTVDDKEYKVTVNFPYGAIDTFYRVFENGETRQFDYFFKGYYHYGEFVYSVDITENNGYIDPSITTVTFVRMDSLHRHLPHKFEDMHKAKEQQSCIEEIRTAYRRWRNNNPVIAQKNGAHL